MRRLYLSVRDVRLHASSSASKPRRLGLRPGCGEVFHACLVGRKGWGGVPAVPLREGSPGPQVPLQLPLREVDPAVPLRGGGPPVGSWASAGLVGASRFVFETSPPESAPGCGEVCCTPPVSSAGGVGSISAVPLSEGCPAPGAHMARQHLSAREVRAPGPGYDYLHVR